MERFYILVLHSIELKIYNTKYLSEVFALEFRAMEFIFYIRIHTRHNKQHFFISASRRPNGFGVGNEHQKLRAALSQILAITTPHRSAVRATL